MRRRKLVQITNPLQSLFSAIERDDREKILALAVLYQDIINQKNRQGLTPLMDAVIRKKYEIMRLLLLHSATAQTYVTMTDGLPTVGRSLFRIRKPRRYFPKLQDIML